VVAEDGDCDGVLTVDDCDDDDANSTNVADDADCDGAVTADDCDDTDATLNLDDADGDTFTTCDGDCDDADFFPTDSDGDGVEDFCGWIDLSAGFYHTCGVKSSASVECWGYDNYGQVSDTPAGT
jgi:hypothetical protein